MSTATIDRLLDSVLDASDAPLDVQQRARAQARELARRLGNQQGLRGHPAAKDAACVLLAMQVHRLPCDKDRLARHASITRPQLTDTFQSARTLLRIELPPLTIADLAVSFGCNQLKPTAMGLLGLVGHFVMQGRVVGDGGVAACFWLVCRAVRQSISKGKLCDRASVTTAELNHIVSLIEQQQQCKLFLDDLDKNRAVAVRQDLVTTDGAAEEEEEEDGDHATETEGKDTKEKKKETTGKSTKTARTSKKRAAVTAIDGITSMDTLDSLKHTKRYRDFIQWRDTTLPLLPALTDADRVRIASYAQTVRISGSLCVVAKEEEEVRGAWDDVPLPPSLVRAGL